MRVDNRELLLKYIDNRCSDQEVEDVITLLSSEDIPEYLSDIIKEQGWSRLENNSLERLDKLSKVLDNIKAETKIDRVDSEREDKRIEDKRIYNPISRESSRNFIELFRRIAATLFIPLLLGLGALLYKVLDNQNIYSKAVHSVTVPIGARSDFTLPDGTLVHLNSGSVLKYPMIFSDDNRVVSLEGEAYFDVAKDSLAPFIVNTEGIDIEVHGTQFNVRCYSDEKNSVIALLEGSVELGSYGDGTKEFEHLRFIEPNDVAIYNRDKNSMKIHSNSNIDKHIGWKDGVLIFDNDPIGAVVKRFEKLYNVDIDIVNSDILKYRFTATFVNESLERSLQMLNWSSPIKCEILNSNDLNSRRVVRIDLKK